MSESNKLREMLVNIGHDATPHRKTHNLLRQRTYQNRLNSGNEEEAENSLWNRNPFELSSRNGKLKGPRRIRTKRTLVDADLHAMKRRLTSSISPDSRSNCFTAKASSPNWNLNRVSSHHNEKRYWPEALQNAGGAGIKERN